MTEVGFTLSCALIAAIVYGFYVIEQMWEFSSTIKQEELEEEERLREKAATLRRQAGEIEDKLGK